MPKRPKKARAKSALPCYIRNPLRMSPLKKTLPKKAIPLRNKSALKKKRDLLARKSEVRAKSEERNIVGKQEVGEKTTKGNQHDNDVMPREFHERVLEIIADHLGVDKDKISSTSSLVNDLRADDIDLMSIIWAFEDEFGVTIPSTDKVRRGVRHSFSCGRTSYSYLEISLLTGDTVGEIEQYLLEHKSVTEP